MSIKEFAKRINRDRTTVYNIFKRKSIDTDLLIKVSDALDYDFINEVYFPQKTDKAPRKILVAVEVEEGEIGKLDLPAEFVRFVKRESM